MGRTLVWLLLLLNALYWSWAQGWLLPYGFGPAQHLGNRQTAAFFFLIIPLLQDILL